MTFLQAFYSTRSQLRALVLLKCEEISITCDDMIHTQEEREIDGGGVVVTIHT